MGVALSMLLSTAGLALVALAMARHHRDLFGRPPSSRAALAYRVLGAALTAAAPFPWIGQTSLAMALVTWLFCGLPLAALIVVAGCTALGLRGRVWAMKPRPGSPPRPIPRP